MNEQTLKIYDEYTRHLLECRRLSFEHFDKAILTLSSGGLGLSITFIHNIVSPYSAINKIALVTAWVSFALSVLSTLVSFITSQFAFDRQISLAEEYYVKNNEEALKKRNKPALVTRLLNIMSAFFFIMAVSSLLCFVSTNIYKEVDMSKKEANEIALFEGIVPPGLTKMPTTNERGVVPPQMPAKPTQPSGQTGEGTQNDTKPNPSEAIKVIWVST